MITAQSHAADLHTAFDLFGHVDADAIGERMADALIGILSTPWERCGGGVCNCGCLFCPFCGCHMNQIEAGEDGHTETCSWAIAATACGLGAAP